MKVLVTGAGGFLGRRVVAALVERGHEVRALVRRPVDGIFDPATEVVTGDLRRAGDVPALLEGVHTVVHLAAVVVGGATAQFHGTVTATENLLAGMAQAEVERLVLCSSFSVYDWSEVQGRLTEDSPLEADLATRDGYATAKLWQERICRRAADGAPWSLTVLRPGFIWGAGGGEWVWGVGVETAGQVLVVGSRKPLPLTHVDNCADAFATVVGNPLTEHGTYNVVDDYRVTPVQYARAYADWHGGKVVVVPHRLLRTTGVLASGMLRALSGRPARLPALFDPHLFDARFKPLDYPPSRLTTVGWQPPYDWDDCVARTFDPAGASASAA